MMQHANHFTGDRAPLPLSFSSRNPRGSRRKALGGRVQALSVVIHRAGRQSGFRRKALWKTTSPNPRHFVEMASPHPKTFRRNGAPRTPRHFAEMALPELRHFAVKLSLAALVLLSLSACSTSPPERFGRFLNPDESHVWWSRIHSGKELAHGLD